MAEAAKAFLLVTLPVLLTIFGAFSFLRSDIAELRQDVKEVTRNVNNVVVRLAGQESPSPSGEVLLTPVGGHFALTFDPRFIELSAPDGAVRTSLRILLQPHCASSAGLGSPQGVKIARWSYGFTAFARFERPVAMFIRYTADDLQTAGVTRPEDLTVIGWVPSKGQWSQLLATVDTELQKLRVEIGEPGCLTLAGKSPQTATQ